MQLTNHAGLPDPIVRAVQWSDRDTGHSDYTVTELISPPRIVALKRKHAKELVEDASERIWALLGSAAHEVLRRATAETELCEQRFFARLADKTISGQVDYSPATGEIFDYKLTSVWAIKDGVKPEWEQQLNCYRWLMAQAKVLTTDTLKIIALLRDWSKPEAARTRDYPPIGVAVLPVRVWSMEETEAWLASRIALHEAARTKLPLCSADDMWERPEKWAVKKRGNQRATKVFDDPQSAAVFAASGTQYEVEHRPGERVRCEHYCIASTVCEQYRLWKYATAPQEAAEA